MLENEPNYVCHALTFLSVPLFKRMLRLNTHACSTIPLAQLVYATHSQKLSSKRFGIETQSFGFCPCVELGFNKTGLLITPSFSGKIKGITLFEIIALSITLPAVTCTIGIKMCRYITERIREARINATTHQNLDNPPSISMQQFAISSRRRSGLDLELPTTAADVAAVDSYRKVVLGESRQITGTNSSTCPICLAEFKTRETLGFMAECNHCFHADCIDEWLRLHMSCPICRNSPSSVLLSQHDI